MLDKNAGQKGLMTGRNIFELKMLRWVVMVWVGCILVWGFTFPGGDRQPLPGREPILVALMIIHAAIYWLILSPVIKKKVAAILLSVQAGLFVVICLVAMHLLVYIFLYLTLVGITILSISQVRQAILAGVIFLVLGIPAYIFYSNFVGIDVVPLFYVPVTLFIIVAAILFTQQVYAQARTQNLLDELAESHRQLEAYADQVEDLTLTNERQRMARELHDTLAQGLAGIILQLEAADSHLVNEKFERAQTIIRQAMTRARAALAESRQVIDQLRKDSVPTLSELQTMIREEVERFSTSTGIPVSLHMDADAPISIPQQDCAHRAVAEALLNIARHAGASQVWVSMSVSPDKLSIEIRDNGAGFNPVNVIGQVGHYGLVGLRERARLIGGTLEVISAPMQGTSIHICLPLRIEVSNG